jgi:hypothetical protein
MADGTEDWAFYLPHALEAGKYRAMSSAATADHQEACCELGQNYVQFTLR